MRMRLEKIIGERGQGIVEYALILAFVVGCGAALFSNNGLATGIKQAFTQVADVIGGGSHLPQIDESNYTDEEKEDKANMDNIARAIEKAIRDGVVSIDDGYTAFLVVQKGDNNGFDWYLTTRRVADNKEEALHLNGNLLDPQGRVTNSSQASNSNYSTGVSWGNNASSSVPWDTVSSKNLVMTDMWGIVKQYGSNGLHDQTVKSSTTGYYGVAIKSNGNNSYTTTYYTYKGSNGSYRGLIESDHIGSVTWTK